METNEQAVVACEIKICVTAKSFAKIQELIERLRDQIEGDYTLNVALSGEVVKSWQDYQFCPQPV